MATPARRALLVIDVQNEYISGDLLVEYPDPVQSLTNIGAAMDAARTSGIPVVTVQNARFAAVLTTAEWIDAIASDKEPERDTIFGSNQRALQTRPRA